MKFVETDYRRAFVKNRQIWYYVGFSSFSVLLLNKKYVVTSNVKMLAEYIFEAVIVLFVSM